MISELGREPFWTLFQNTRSWLLPPHPSQDFGDAAKVLDFIGERAEIGVAVGVQENNFLAVESGLQRQFPAAQLLEDVEPIEQLIAGRSILREQIVSWQNRSTFPPGRFSSEASRRLTPALGPSPFRRAFTRLPRRARRPWPRTNRVFPARPKQRTWGLSVRASGIVPLPFADRWLIWKAR